MTEEYLKLYVAYKAETNFVDVVPQAKRLRLLLNMEFAEITDPKGICRELPASVDGGMATWKLLSVPSKNCRTSSGWSDNHLNVKWAMATKTRSQFA